MDLYLLYHRLVQMTLNYHCTDKPFLYYYCHLFHYIHMIVWYCWYWFVPLILQKLLLIVPDLKFLRFQ